jgi:hypothetical protein
LAFSIAGSGARICCSRAPTGDRLVRQARNATPAAAISAHSPSAISKATPNARRELSEARRLVGDNRYSSIARLRAIGLGGAESPRLGRSHLFRRPAQGRNAGRMKIGFAGQHESSGELLV